MSIGRGDYSRILNTIPRKEGTEKIISAFFDTDEDMIIRAPAGSGKTFVAVAYAIAKATEEKRTVIFFRTRAELENALGIAKTIIDNANIELEAGAIIPVAGREALCPFGSRGFEGLPDFAKSLYCLVMECPVRFRRILEPPKLYTSLRDFVSYIMGYKACAYHTLLRLAKNARVVFATHPFLTQDELFRHLGDVDTAIVDEAHALNIVTYSISREKYERGRSIAEEVSRIIREAEERGETGAVKRWILENWAFERKKILLYEEYKFFRSRQGELVFVGDEMIKVLPPRTLLEMRRNRVRRFVVMSATLYPIGMIKKLWGIRKAVIVGKLIQRTKNRLYVGLVLPGITTKLQRRDKRLYRAIAGLIKYIHRIAPDKLIVVFCVSKEFAKYIAEILNKEVISDPNQIRSTEENLIITYARGKLSEGIDAIGGRNPDVVIAVGLPYPAVDKKFLRITGKVAEMIGVDRNQFVRDYMNSEMIGALVQLLGRAGRRKKGLCMVIDERVVIFPDIPFVTNTLSLKDVIRRFFGG